jgi:hypothetical protein
VDDAAVAKNVPTQEEDAIDTPLGGLAGDETPTPVSPEGVCLDLVVLPHPNIAQPRGSRQVRWRKPPGPQMWWSRGVAD